jgi:hypothetical protein
LTDTTAMATGGEHGGRPKEDGFRKNPSNVRPALAQALIDF